MVESHGLKVYQNLMISMSRYSLSLSKKVEQKIRSLMADLREENVVVILVKSIDCDKLVQNCADLVSR